MERLSAKAVTAKKTSPLAVVVSPSVPDPSPPVKKQNNSRPEIVCADKQPGCILYTVSHTAKVGHLTSNLKHHFPTYYISKRTIVRALDEDTRVFSLFSVSLGQTAVSVNTTLHW